MAFKQGEKAVNEIQIHSSQNIQNRISYYLIRFSTLILFKLGNICCESLLDYLILRMFIMFTLVVISYLLRRSPCNYLTLSRAIQCDGEIYYDIVMCCVRGAHSSQLTLPTPTPRQHGVAARVSGRLAEDKTSSRRFQHQHGPSPRHNRQRGWGLSASSQSNSRSRSR